MTKKITTRITDVRVIKEAKLQTPQGFVDDKDRRLRLEKVPIPTVASLRWTGRPVLPEGSDARVYQAQGPAHKFCVSVGHVRNGHDEPFETWVLGEAPRGLSAIAKSLSMDMRSRDRGYLKAKLESIAHTEGEPFDMQMPNGQQVRVRSEVAAFARLVLWRCEELGAFDDMSETPVLDAMMSRKEPKTTPDGATAFFCDVVNPATDDDFTLFVKEAVLPDGQRRPFSVWLSGTYPASLNGLCKALSFDLRVVEVEWGVRKLNQLLDVDEPRGAFFAQVPGSEKRSTYPSTVAYVAALLLHRLKVLGLTGLDGQTVAGSGVVSISGVGNEPEESVPSLRGPVCESCGSYNVKIDGGCSICLDCSFSRCGG